MPGMYGGSPVAIIGLQDAVGSRVNVAIRGGKLIRCSVAFAPASPLVDRTLEAMKAALPTSAYCRLLGLVQDRLQACDRDAQQEWAATSRLLLHWCKGQVSLVASEARRQSQRLAEQDAMAAKVASPHSAWDALLRSRFHTRMAASCSFSALQLPQAPPSSTAAAQDLPSAGQGAAQPASASK
ncbi:hypothetical protein CYMTET_36540, partial [Cymbomonas tetramitiformis]